MQVDQTSGQGHIICGVLVRFRHTRLHIMLELGVFKPRLFHDRAFVPDRLERLEQFVARHSLAALSADDAEMFFVIDLDGKHARCLLQGSSGFGDSAITRHADDFDFRARHVGGDFVAAGVE